MKVSRSVEYFKYDVFLSVPDMHKVGHSQSFSDLLPAKFVIKKPLPRSCHDSLISDLEVSI